MEVKEETCIKIVLSTCILHNYLRVKNCDIDNLDEVGDEGESFQALTELDMNNRRGTNVLLRFREQFVDFFNL